MVGLPEQRRGGIGLVFATVFVAPSDQAAMTEDGWAQLRYYRALADERRDVRLVGTRGELAALLRDWEAAHDPSARPVGYVPLMEGADPIREPGELEEWYRAGIRIVGPAWRGTRYAGGTRAPGPLTALGRALLREMERLGVILDTSHLAEASFWDAMATFSGTVIASHANSRAYVPGDRHLTDEMIRAIVERDGVIGTVLANPFLVGGWTVDDEPVTLEAVVRHVDHVCQLAGSARHCGIGSDFDGISMTPVGLEDVSKFPALTAELLRRGYSDGDVKKVLGENVLRVMREVERVAARLQKERGPSAATIEALDGTK